MNVSVAEAKKYSSKFDQSGVENGYL